MVKTELINYQDKLYNVYRKVKEAHIKKMEFIQEIKDLWSCDLALKTKNQNQEDIILFLREIPELEIIP